jgi:hypothetical protein
MAGKLTPNPNVMLEYGYALRAKSHSVMIPVMNTAYGPPEKLPFDMAHLRHPLQYDLPATATNFERRTVRKALTEEFETILRRMIAVAPAKPAALFEEAKSVGSPAFFFQLGATIAPFEPRDEAGYKFEGDSAIYLRLFPKYRDGQQQPGRAGVRTLLRDRRIVNPMSVANVGIASANDYGWIVIDPRNNGLTEGITQAFPTGELWGINSQVFVRAAIHRTLMSPAEPAVAFGVISVEKLCTRTLEHYASIAAAEIKLRPPFVVEIGAVGLKGLYVGAPHPDFSQGHYYGPIREANLVRRYDLPDIRRATLFGELRRFFEEVYDLAEISRSEVLTNEHVSRYDIAPRT